MTDTFSPALEMAIDDFDGAALSFGLAVTEWDSVKKNEISKAHAVSKQTLRAAIRAEVEAAAHEKVMVQIRIRKQEMEAHEREVEAAVAAWKALAYQTLLGLLHDTDRDWCERCGLPSCQTALDSLRALPADRSALDAMLAEAEKRGRDEGLQEHEVLRMRITDARREGAEMGIQWVNANWYECEDCSTDECVSRGLTDLFGEEEA